MTEPHRPFWFLRRRSPAIAADVDDELREHLDRRTGALIAEGLPPGEARREAVRRFGDIDSTRRYCRQQDEEKERGMQRRLTVSDVVQDARIAIRGLLRVPVLASTIVASVG